MVMILYFQQLLLLKVVEVEVVIQETLRVLMVVLVAVVAHL
jgi:hypothetical protein